jgi:hypothetical protein
MSSLMVDFIISLDGYGAAEGWPGLWGMAGPEYLAFIEATDESQHTCLMGATTSGVSSLPLMLAVTLPTRGVSWG